MTDDSEAPGPGRVSHKERPFKYRSRFGVEADIPPLRRPHVKALAILVFLSALSSTAFAGNGHERRHHRRSPAHAIADVVSAIAHAPDHGRAYQDPHAPAPVYHAPVYQESDYHAPVFQAPVYRAPSHAPAHHAPVYHAPAHTTSEHAPVYEYHHGSH